MMRIAMITRASLYTVPGGDTIQVTKTAEQLRELGIAVTVCLANEAIDYSRYDLLHFFNITRPADILKHIEQSGKRFLVSPVFVDYRGFDRYHRKGLPGLVARMFSGDGFEYLKTIARWLRGNDQLVSWKYLWTGQRKSVRKILTDASMILPNSFSENRRLLNAYGIAVEHMVIVNGVDTALFTCRDIAERNPNLVICVGRIEGIKNQLNLIRALNHSSFHLLIIGKPAPNQLSYYQECRKIAAENIQFIDQLTQEELVLFYAKATVHVLPSFFETTGLSSLEAAIMGCHIVVSGKGDVYDYFGDAAVYCEPDSPESILQAVTLAAAKKTDPLFQKKIRENYTWQQAAIHTVSAYRKVYATISNADRYTGYKGHSQSLRRI
jgi:glycosyltransferase involved in cell wall biosynthesis